MAPISEMLSILGRAANVAKLGFSTGRPSIDRDDAACIAAEESCLASHCGVLLVELMRARMRSMLPWWCHGLPEQMVIIAHGTKTERGSSHSHPI